MATAEVPGYLVSPQAEKHRRARNWMQGCLKITAGLTPSFLWGNGGTEKGQSRWQPLSPLPFLVTRLVSPQTQAAASETFPDHSW